MPMKIKQIGAGLLAALMILTVAGCKPSDDPVSDSSLSESGSTDPSGETGPGTDSTTDPLGTDGSDPTNPDSSSGSGSTASRPPVHDHLTGGCRADRQQFCHHQGRRRESLYRHPLLPVQKS